MKRSKHSTKLTLAQSGTAKEYLFTEITIKSKWKAFRLCQFQYWDKFSNTKLRHYHSSSSHHSSSPLSSTTLDSNAKRWLQYHIIFQFEPNFDRIVCESLSVVCNKLLFRLDMRSNRFVFCSAADFLCVFMFTSHKGRIISSLCWRRRERVENATNATHWLLT